jgi:hypothetical protein
MVRLLRSVQIEQMSRSLRVTHIDGIATSSIITIVWVGVRRVTGIHHGRSTGRIRSVDRGREWVFWGRHGMLYARTGCSGWVRNAKVHRQWKGVARAGPTVVKGAVRVGVWCGMRQGVRGGTRPVMVIVVDGVTASGVLLEKVVNFSRIARVVIPSEDHSATHHHGESDDESDYAKDHAHGAFVGKEAFLCRACGRPGGNDRLGSCRVGKVAEIGSGAEVCEGRLRKNIA